MKSIIIKMFLISLITNLYAFSIDPNTAKAHFVGFKTTKRLAVHGVIDNAKFNFASTNGGIKNILEGATAKMDFINENTKDKIRERNIFRTFITSLKDTKITAKVLEVSGGEFVGDLIAFITFNNIGKEVKMKYEVVNGKLIVSGFIDMNTDFDLADSFLALSTDKQIAALHNKKTWSDVEIYFDVDIK